jgi:DNA-binding MarR family transcriptional regulator
MALSATKKPSRSGGDRAQTATLALLKQVQYRCYLNLERALSPLGVAAVHYRILTTLKLRGKLSSAQLARLYDVRPQTMFKQVSLLLERGLVRRAPSKANKRVQEVELSDKGDALLVECDVRADRVEQSIFRRFTDGEFTLYRELTLRLLEAMKARQADQARPRQKVRARA